MITIKIQILESINQKFHITVTQSGIHEDSLTTSLPAIPIELESSLKQWKLGYYSLRSVSDVCSSLRITAISAITSSELCEYRNSIKSIFNQWLDTNNKLREHLIRLASQPKSQNQITRILLEIQNTRLYYFPWQEWNLFESYFPQSEISIRVKGKGDEKVKPISRCWKVRILLVIGNSEGIQPDRDLKIVKDLEKKGASVTILKNPSRETLRDVFKQEPGYHIFVFAGHSQSNEDGTIGWIELNPEDSLTIKSFKDNFKRAIDRGLQLAIFNSCDGLGLAQQIAELNLPQSIVMREPIPDKIAVEFLKHFFHHFSQNKSVVFSLRETRKDLEPFEREGAIPGAQWLPVLCTRESATPVTWKQFRKNRNPYILLSLAATIVATGLFVTQKNLHPIELSNLSNCPQKITPTRQRENIGQTLAPKCFVDVANVPKGTWLHSGSTTWAPIRGTINPKLENIFPDFNLSYTEHPDKPPGSGTGIGMLLDGQISFAESSRPLNEDELRQASMRGIQLKQDAIAIDAIAVAVHPHLPIDNLTLAQLKGIYTGTIDNWKKIGGPDLKIDLYARSQDSGTMEFFQTYVLGGSKFSDRVVEIDTPTLAIRKLSDDNKIGGIFFATASQLVPQCGIKTLSLRRNETNSPISPYQKPLISPENCQKDRHNTINLDAFRNNEYPIVRRIFLITRQDNGVDKQAGEAYYTLLLSDEGQTQIEEAGFIPIR
ncbi:MAG: substrate-binding domain-containing protein [Geitlerinemataceae cyanobacterium]